MNSLTRPGFMPRLGLVLLGIWCAFFVFAFFSGLSAPQERSIVWRIGALVLILTPSLLLFRFLLRREIRRTQAQTEETNRIAVERKRQEAFVSNLRRNALSDPVPAIVQGGSGTDLSPGQLVLLSCRVNELVLSSPIRQFEVKIPFGTLRAIEITGPGTVTTDAGIVGGGFGIEGALKGMLVASIVNTMTSKTTTNTFVRIASKGSEVHLHITARDTRQLRLDLSSAFVAIESQRGDA